MPLTRPIPPEAMPVVWVLRSDVRRPHDLPLAYAREPLRFKVPGGTCCPMGLHRKARSLAPTTAQLFPTGVGRFAVRSFGWWWDEQSDPIAAMDAVWPPPAASRERQG